MACSRLGNPRAPLQTRVSALYPHSHVLFRFPFSFTDPPLPFKRNGTHIQRHRCSSLVSFLLFFFSRFVLIKCIVLGIAALRSQTTVQGNKQISGGLFAKPTLGFQALSGAGALLKGAYWLYPTSKEFSYVRSVCLTMGWDGK